MRIVLCHFLGRAGRSDLGVASPSSITRCTDEGTPEAASFCTSCTASGTWPARVKSVLSPIQASALLVERCHLKSVRVCGTSHKSRPSADSEPSGARTPFNNRAGQVGPRCSVTPLIRMQHSVQSTLVESHRSALDVTASGTAQSMRITCHAVRSNSNQACIRPDELLEVVATP